jgi:hypothetical protein
VLRGRDDCGRGRRVGIFYPNPTLEKDENSRMLKV